MTDGSSNIRGFIQRFNDFRLKVPVANAGLFNPGTAAITQAVTVPAGINVEAVLTLLIVFTNAADMVNAVYVSDLNAPDLAPTGVNVTGWQTIANNTLGQMVGGGQFTCWTNTSSQVRYRLGQSGPTSGINLNTVGWKDPFSDFSVGNATLPSVTQPILTNQLINGNFDLWQRGTIINPIANLQYLADRWYVSFNSTGAYQAVQAVGAPSIAQSGVYSSGSARIVVNTADASPGLPAYLYVGQKIEGYRYARFAQQPFSLSFWVQATTPGKYCVAALSGGTDYYCVLEYTVAAAATWQYVTLTFPAPPSAGTWSYTNGIGMYLCFTQMCGTNRQTATPGVWTAGLCFATANQVNNAAVATNGFYISQVNLVAGSTPQPFQPIGWQAEQRDASRYGLLLSSAYIGITQNTAAMYNGGVFTFAQPMRATPGIDTGLAASFTLSPSGTAGTVLIQQPGVNSVGFQNGANNWPGANYQVMVTCFLQAEL
jgi:hypothetical protein